MASGSHRFGVQRSIRPTDATASADGCREGAPMYPIDRSGRSRRARSAVALAVLSAVAIAGSACSKSPASTTSSGPTVYSVFVQKFRFHGLPASVKAGNFTIDFSNRESLPITHEMVLISLPSGKTSQNVIDDAKTGGTKSEDEWL